MLKRTAIWIAVLLALIGAFVEIQTLRRNNATVEGQVTYKNKSGNLIQVMLDSLSRYGAAVTVTNTVPMLNAEWQYAEDSNGFQILLPKKYSKQFVQCVTQVLGKPVLQPQYPQLFYNEARFGAFVSADLDSDPVHIICLRKGSLGP